MKPELKNQIIRATQPGHPACYVKRVGRTGGFEVTFRKENARKMHAGLAHVNVQQLSKAQTQMQFEAIEVVA